MTDFIFWKRPQALLGRELARQFRKAPTPSERILWNALRGRRLDGLKFRRQVPIGPFVVDFACYALRLFVEVDGGVHDAQREADAERQQFLEGQGFQVLRVPAREVERSLETVLTRIRRAAARGTTPTRG